jgi:serine protease AprX
MRQLRRLMLAGAAGLMAVASVGAAHGVATADDRPVTFSLPGEVEQVRLDPVARTYQISRDGGREWSRPQPQATHVHLRSRSFDPLTAPPAEAKASEGTASEGTASVGTAAGAAYIVQFHAAPLDSQRRDLAKRGVRLGAYLPDYAFVARMSPATRDAVRALPYVRWIGAYQPADRLAPGLKPGRIIVTLVDVDGARQRGLADQIAAAGGTVHVVSTNGRLIVATVNQAQLDLVAGRPEVLAVDAWSAPQSDMDKARFDGGANFIETLGGYRGAGVRGEVMDGGLRTTHQEFVARRPIIHAGNTTDTVHGTSTYGQIFASGVSASRRGMLPEGQGIFAAYDRVTDRHAHTGQLVNPTGSLRAVFQSNSFGSDLTTAYTGDSALMDDIVFDHDILICQSQSNSGTTLSRPEAWAKNVVSVGGHFHRNTVNKVDDSWSDPVLTPASIGPAADGRIKPDLVSYYDQIATTTSSNDRAYTSTFGGTSGATPITCGNFGLLFQMWADGVFAGGPGLARDVFASRPHASTAKALMINQANQYAFFGPAHDLTRTHQGWGTPHVGNLFTRAMNHHWTLPILVNETDLVSTGQRRVYTMRSHGEEPLKATLVWTDPAGSPSATRAQVNDLTLKVTSPGGTVYWGNNGLATGNWSTPGGVANRVDTVENVFIQTPQAGDWTIEVLGDAVNQDGHVETAATDADFGLVVTGRKDLLVPSPGPRAGAVGAPVTGTHTVSGGTAPYTWTVTNAPPGLAINAATGDLSGTPTVAGEFTVTVTATDSTNPARTGSTTYNWTIAPNGTPAVVPNLIGVFDGPGTVESILEGAGLTLGLRGTMVDDPTCNHVGFVMDQDPAPGTQVPMGTAVAYFVGVAPPGGCF